MLLPIVSAVIVGIVITRKSKYTTAPPPSPIKDSNGVCIRPVSAGTGKERCQYCPSGSGCNTVLVCPLEDEEGKAPNLELDTTYGTRGCVPSSQADNSVQRTTDGCWVIPTAGELSGYRGPNCRFTSTSETGTETVGVRQDGCDTAAGIVTVCGATNVKYCMGSFPDHSGQVYIGKKDNTSSPSPCGGQTCSEDSDCVTNACGRASADIGTALTCCESGETDTYAGYDYCTNMADGTTCWSNDMCAKKRDVDGIVVSGGFCADNGGGTRRGYCGKGKIGQPCGVDGDCVNNACGRASADSGTSGSSALTCCESGKTDTYAGFDYCTNMGKGTTCWSDAMCASGDCKGNWDGLQRGTC